DDDDRLAVLTAVLVHDLGKNLTPPPEWPSHRGHERSGLQLVDALLDRLPSLADARARRLARAGCARPLGARAPDELRPGTLATMYEEWFKWTAFPVALFALAIGADAGGRLGRDAEGDRVCAEVTAAVTRIRARCASV